MVGNIHLALAGKTGTRGTNLMFVMGSDLILLILRCSEKVIRYVV